MDLPMRPGLDTIPADEQKRYESEDKEIIAVVGSGSRGAYLSNDYWVASADVIGYAFSEKPEELHELKTRLVWAKAKDSKEKSPFEKETVYRVKVRFPLEKDGMTGDELISRMGVYVTQIISCGESNAQTEALLNEYKKEIFIDSPVLGKLVLDKGLGSYMGNAKWNGSDIDILIDHDEDTEESIPMLEEFFRNSAENDAVLRKFAASELTGLANEWLADSEDDDEEEQKEITEEEFARRISPDGINFSSDGTYSFYFYDDDMFWGHSVTVYGSVTEGPDEANIEG